MLRASIRTLAMIISVVMTLGAPAFGDRAAPAKAKVDPYLAAQLASSAGPVTVMVHGMSVDAARDAVDLSGLTAIETFERIGVVAAVGSKSQILAAGRAAGVTYLEGDRPVRFNLNSSHQATRGDQAMDGFNEGSEVSSPLAGNGISIAVLDNGIDGTHPMFQVGGASKVLRNMKLACHQVLAACTGPVGDANDPVWIDFTNTTNDTDSLSAGGHGTHVAGIAAGVPVTTTNGVQLRGAAPGAKLIGLSIAATLSIYGGASGMNWVLEHHDAPCGSDVPASSCPPIRVVNNSWGAVGGSEYNKDGAVAKIQDALVADGVTVVWAAGNGDVTNDGGDGSDNRVDGNAASPTPGIIGVANYDDAGTGSRNGTLDSSSSRGHSTRSQTWPDLSAPGSNITSACRPYLVICSDIISDDPNYGTIGGTSMAAPHVAGYVALLLEASPTLTPGEIEDLLEDTAFKFTYGAPYEPVSSNPDNTSSFDKGHGLVDVKAAVAELRNIELPSETPLPGGGFECLTDGAVARDVEGDTYLVKHISTGFQVPPHEPSLDITEGRLSWDATAQALTAKIKVLDLPETPSAGAPHLSFNVNFLHGDGRYYFEATKDATGEHYSFGRWTMVSTQGARLVLGESAGSFDPATNTITLVLTNANLAGASVAPLAEGEVLTGISFASRRPVRTDATTVGLTSDSTDELCAYKIGTGVIDLPPPPPPPPPPPADGSIDTTNPKHTWTQEASPDAILFFEDNPSGCSGAYNDEDCDIERVNVTVPAGGRNLRITLSAWPTSQYWLWVYAPDGSLFGDSSLVMGDQVVEDNATLSGVYQIVAQSIYSTAGPYSGIAELVAPAPPAGTPDGSISSSDPEYTWEEGPTTDANIFDCGEAPDYEFCDVQRVQVDVPVGGAPLKVQLTADLPDVNDFDLYVYGPDGSLFDKSATGGSNEIIQKQATASGIYTIVVQAFTTVEAKYTGLAKLVL